MYAQPGILAPVPPHACFLFLNRSHGTLASQALTQLRALVPEGALVGLGSSLVGSAIPGLRPMPAWVGEASTNPSTPSDLLLRVPGADPGEVLHRTRPILAALSAFNVVDRVDGFMFGQSQDLTGYIDGTENPTGSDAANVALQAQASIQGASIVAVQRWIHDLDHFESLSAVAQNHVFGRSLTHNEELEQAPESAHVKRTAQEDFSPQAFLVRRSMPWSDHRGSGLIFVSFSASLDPFEAQLRRMMGFDDGITDALYRFTRPVTGATFWCPPLRRGHLNLSALFQPAASAST